MTTKKHLLILAFVTLLTRGLLFISFPMGGIDDDQSAHRWQIEQILDGNLLIGNLRYHTGYPLLIAPVAALAQPLGRYADRAILLVQTCLSALAPFMLYDIFRRRPSPRTGLVVALAAALDPFGLQWAHFALPNWLIGLLVVLAMWLVHRGLTGKRLWLFTAAAGVVFGLAMLARLNLVPIAALFGASFFFLNTRRWKERLRLFLILGCSSAAILGLYIALIHYPSTGVWSLSCYTGTNLLVSAYIKQFDLTADNGPATRRLLELLSIDPPRPIAFTSEIYPRWAEPGSWATAEEYEAFTGQTGGTPDTVLTTAWPGNLFYYLGPCATDDLLLEVHNEALRAQPLRWLLSIPVDVFNMLAQRIIPGEFHPRYLPHVQSLTFEGNNVLGFQRAYGDFYNGQWAWQPGIAVFSGLFDAWNAFKWLTPLAVVWGVFKREWFYRTSALLLLAFLVSISIFGNPAPRLYAPLHPLTPLLIGGMLAAAIDFVQKRRTPRRLTSVEPETTR